MAYCSNWWTGCFNQSGFGFNQPDPAYGVGGVHPGIDIGLPSGTPVKAGGAGSVIFAGWDGLLGNAVIVALSDGTRVLLGHLSQIAVHAGQSVNMGDVLGKSGSTGNSTGPHLHFEVRNARGTATNPLSFLASGGGSNSIGSGAGGASSTDQGFLGIPGAINNFTTTVQKGAIDLSIYGGFAILAMLLIFAGLLFMVFSTNAGRSAAKEGAVLATV